MSNVFVKDRSETKLQFFVNAIGLQKSIITYTMSEKVLPKKWRYALGYPLISLVNELVNNITYANSIFPNNNENLELRKRYQTLAIANCFQIQNSLIVMEQCVQTVKVEQMTEIIDKLSHEIALLKAWQKSNKIIKQDK